MSLTPKATIAQVPVGILSIEGLMREDDGTFGIAMPQLASHDLIPPNRSLKQLNSLHSTAFQSHQWRTTLHPKAVNVILVPDFEKLLAKLDRAGNKAAQDMRDDLVGLALTQLFSDAFGQKFEKWERQAYLIDRQSHREDFHPYFTAWGKLDGLVDVQYAVRLNQFKAKLDLPIATVDTYDSKQLRILDKAYIKYDTLRTTGMTHSNALSLF